VFGNTFAKIWGISTSPFAKTAKLMGEKELKDDERSQEIGAVMKERLFTPWYVLKGPRRR
jgi:hypothetical protein